jgi:hypothetical protein
MAPLFQRYEAAGEEVNTTEPPAQNVVGPLGVTVGVGFGLTVTFTGAEVALHPLPSVTSTVYDPATVTNMLCEICPLLHRYEDAADDVSSTPPP